MTQSSLEVSEDLLSTMRKLVDENMQFVPAERRVFFEALQKLQEGDVKEAGRLFRKAARKSETPLEQLAVVGLAACEYAGGKEGAALKSWRKLAEDDEVPEAVRYMAWLNIAALDEARDDKVGLSRAKKALEALGEPTAF
ncbi:MAG: hypothetical protein ACNA8W_02795 [Bradymonadaceae bacterium]